MRRRRRWRLTRTGCCGEERLGLNVVEVHVLRLRNEMNEKGRPDHSGRPFFVTIDEGDQPSVGSSPETSAVAPGSALGS